MCSRKTKNQFCLSLVEIVTTVDAAGESCFVNMYLFSRVDITWFKGSELLRKQRFYSPELQSVSRT